MLFNWANNYAFCQFKHDKLELEPITNYSKKEKVYKGGAQQNKPRSNLMDILNPSMLKKQKDKLFNIQKQGEN